MFSQVSKIMVNKHRIVCRGPATCPGFSLEAGNDTGPAVTGHVKHPAACPGLKPAGGPEPGMKDAGRRNGQ